MTDIKKQSEILNDEYIQYVQTLKEKKYQIDFGKQEVNKLISFLSKFGEFKFTEAIGLVAIIDEWKSIRNTLTGLSNNETVSIPQPLLEATIYFVGNVKGCGVEEAIEVSDFLQIYGEPFVKAQKELETDRKIAKEMEDKIQAAIIEESQEKGESSYEQNGYISA